MRTWRLSGKLKREGTKNRSQHPQARAPPLPLCPTGLQSAYSPSQAPSGRQAKAHGEGISGPASSLEQGQETRLRAPTPASSAFRPEPGLAHSPLPKVALIQAASTFQDAKPTGFVSACDSPAPQRPLCPADHALLPLTRSAVSALAFRGEHKRRGLQSHLPNSDGPGATQP